MTIYDDFPDERGEPEKLNEGFGSILACFLLFGTPWGGAWGWTGAGVALACAAALLMLMRMMMDLGAAMEQEHMKECERESVRNLIAMTRTARRKRKNRQRKRRGCAFCGLRRRSTRRCVIRVFGSKTPHESLACGECRKKKFFPPQSICETLD